MKAKTEALSGAALDWAVMSCEGHDYEVKRYGPVTGRTVYDEDGLGWEDLYSPSTNWLQGGPIIEKEKIGVWWATHYVDDEGEEYGNHWYAEATVCEAGPTPLIAAMRCYVLSKLGDEVDIPDELNH